MEPITHALSGAALAGALTHKKPVWWFPLWAMLVAASPDVDVFFIRSPLQYIVWHRGITHSLVGGTLLALMLALPLFAFLRTRHRPPDLLDLSAKPASFLKIWFIACLLVLHHIWLDCMNSYGTQVFLPFSDYRVRWNALFIVDPLLLLPLAIGLCFWRRRRPVMIALLVWTIVYPLGSLITRLSLESWLDNERTSTASFQQTPAEEALLPEQSGSAQWNTVRGVHLVPDAFTPFHWKLILDRETVWDVAGYTVFSAPPKQFASSAKPPLGLWSYLGEHDRTFRIYQNFSLYPALDAVIRTVHTLPTPDEPEPPVEHVNTTEYIFSDLRFGSTIPFVDAIQVQRDGRPLTFRIMARLNAAGRLVAVRFITTKGAGGDSGWNPPFSE